MKPLLMALLTAGVVSAGDPPPLAPGTNVTLRVRRVIPCDGLSRGERLLNGLPPLKPGDAFTAEVIASDTRPPLILAGSVGEITPPGRFGRPGKVTLRLAQPAAADWWLAVEDQRFTSAQRRRLITSLFLLEGFGVGASIGAQLDRGKAGATLAGAGVGLLLGLGYASFQSGQEASLEPGDTLSVVVGSVCAAKLPPDAPLTVYPAREPDGDTKGKHKP